MAILLGKGCGGVVVVVFGSNLAWSHVLKYHHEKFILLYSFRLGNIFFVNFLASMRVIFIRHSRFPIEVEWNGSYQPHCPITSLPLCPGYKEA